MGCGGRDECAMDNLGLKASSHTFTWVAAFESVLLFPTISYFVHIVLYIRILALTFSTKKKPRSSGYRDPWSTICVACSAGAPGERKHGRIIQGKACSWEIGAWGGLSMPMSITPWE